MLLLLYINSANAQNLTDQQLIELINKQPPEPAGKLKNKLLQNSPLSDAVLLAMLARNPKLPSGPIQDVLFANSPISDGVLIAMLQMNPSLPNGNIKNVLVNESPLSTDVLEAAGTRQPPLPNGILNDVVANNPMAHTINTIDVNCNGGNDGAINLTISGGIPPYSFNWSNGSTTEGISGLTAGSYSITVTDTHSGSLNANATITEPPLLTTSTTQTDVTCNGGNNGTIDLSVAGGISPYSYSWSTGATTDDISSTTAGDYLITVTDANSCTATDNVTINEPPAYVFVPSVTNVSCNGGSDGSIDLTVTGNTSPYSYNWSNGATTENISGLSASTYSVTVTDANNCTGNSEITVTKPEPLAINPIIRHESCEGFGDGFINLAITGGTSPYSYSWSTGATTKNMTQLTGGDYQITITDVNSCTVTQSITLQTLGLSEQLSLINKGVVIKSKGNIIMKVTGNVMSKNDGSYNNEGSINLAGDVVNSSSNKMFDNTAGTIELLAQHDQFIKGNDVDFHAVKLSGTGVKNVNVDAEIYGTLDLTDREFATGINTLTIKNTEPNSIERTEGFVSSEEGGSLVLEMNNTASYLFPVGSSKGTQKYRPVEISPSTTNSQSYSVRFADNDPASDGLSTNATVNLVENINNQGYYNIERVTGSDPVTVVAFYDQVQDGNFNNLAVWDGSQWQRTISATSRISSIESFIKISNYDNFTNTDFALYFRGLTTEDIIITDESPTTQGAFALSITGGMPPYITNIEGEPAFPSEQQFETEKLNFSQIDFTEMGLPDPDIASLTYHQFAGAVFTPIRENLISDDYNVTLIDSLGDTVKITLSVGNEIQWHSQSGVTVTENTVTKTAAGNGWDDGTVTTVNFSEPGEDGSLSFQLDQVNSLQAAGFKDISTPLLPGYDDLDFAFVIDQDQIRIWENNTLSTPISTYKEGDVLTLARQGSDVIFRQNKQVLQTSTSQDKTYQVKFPIYTSGAQFKRIKVKRKYFWPRCKVVSVIHSYCEQPTGIVDIQIAANPLIFFNFSYAWHDQSGTLVATTQDLNNVSAGTYTVNITYQTILSTSVSLTKTVTILNKIDWENVANASLLSIPDNNSIQKTTTGVLPPSKAESMNRLLSGDDGSISFTVNNQFNFYAVVFGFQDPATKFFTEFIYSIGFPSSTANVVYTYQNNQFKGLHGAYNGDRIKISRKTTGSSTAIIFKRNNNTLQSIPVSTNAQKLQAGTVLVFDNGATVFDAAADFCNLEFPLVTSYSVLDKKIQGGYFLTKQGRLFFKHDGEYNSGTLNYKVFGNNSQTPLFSTSGSSPISNTAKNLGDNRYELNFHNVLNAGVYTLLMENEKQETHKLRFRKLW
ncbi:SprB repeat-containing protein [Bacteroidales bacterium AH-315-I05]|nr:SprB repeat-containing protein [Bacteroidales bacterium AH-315-I05]